MKIIEKTFSSETMYTINTLQTHMKELDYLISSFKTYMITSKYTGISHMSMLESDLAIIQDRFKPHEENYY